MNKRELVQRVADKTGLTQLEAGAAVEALFDHNGAIATSLARKETVNIVGFGTFEARERAAREGHNPATGESMQIAARTAPAFRAARGLRSRVDG